MQVVQESYNIPPEIEIGLENGEYYRIGSVIRWRDGPKKGQIIKHLEPVDWNPEEETQSLGEKALQFVKEHKTESILVVAGVTIVGIGVLAYYKVKKCETKEVMAFKSSLKEYIDAVRKGNMDVEKISNLLQNLEELKKNKDYKKISIQLTNEQMEVLVNHIYKYTTKLAKDNGVELPTDELNTIQNEGSCAIIKLQNYLNVQKNIFEGAA